MAPSTMGSSYDLPVRLSVTVKLSCDIRASVVGGIPVAFALVEVIAVAARGERRAGGHADAPVGTTAERAVRIEPEPVRGHVDEIGAAFHGAAHVPSSTAVMRTRPSRASMVTRDAAASALMP